MTFSRSLRRRVLIAAILVALFTVVGFFVLPPIARSQLEKRLSDQLGRRVTVGKVRINPYTASVTLENFAIQEPDGRTLFLGWRRLHVNLGALASLRREWVLSEVGLDGFEANGIVNADHSLNVADLLARFAPAPGAAPQAPTRAVRVRHLAITDSRITVTDRSRSQPFASVIGPLSFELTEFRTVSERGAPYRFEAITEAGETLAWSGTIRAEPFQSAGEFRVENVVLAKYEPFYASAIQADVLDGRLSVQGKYRIDLTPNAQVLALQDGAVQLRSVALRQRGRMSSRSSSRPSMSPASRPMPSR